MAEFPGKFPWLRQTYGHPFKGVEFRVLISLFDHANGQTGLKSHPGLDLLVEETGYGKAAVSAAITALKAKGWIHETYRGNGRSGLSSEFALVPDAPNPDYRCSTDRCSTCSKGSPTGEALTQPKGSSLDETLNRNGSPFGLNGSPTDEPIVRLEANPIDPLPDPGPIDPDLYREGTDEQTSGTDLRGPIFAGLSGLPMEGQQREARSAEPWTEPSGEVQEKESASPTMAAPERGPIGVNPFANWTPEPPQESIAAPTPANTSDPWAVPATLPANDGPSREYPNAVNPFAADFVPLDLR